MLIFYLSLIEDDVGKLVFEKLYDQYKDDVLRLTYSLMKNHHDSEDMAQNTWIYVAKHISNLGVRDDATMKSYIMLVAKNCCIDQFRRRATEITTEDLTQEEVEALLEIDEDILFREICEKDDAKMLFFCLRTLDEEYRDVLNLHYFHGCKVREIASVLHITESNVKQKLARGRRMLADKLKEQGMLYEG